MKSCDIFPWDVFLVFKKIFLWALTIPATDYTDKKENKIVLIYKEIQKGAVAKS